MPYVDGFVLPIAEDKVDAYRKMARKAGKIWREYGALEYRECVGDDLFIDGLLPFPKGIRTKPGETVIFAWIVYKSKADRNRIRKKVMADKRLANMMDPKAMPFDMKRMIYGGFKVMVDL
jgi:uncharacterized protein YbaA (DUF1428 family)